MVAQTSGWSGNKRRTLIGAALLIALIYVAVAVMTDRARLADALRQLGWLGCGAVLLLSALNYLLRFYRWKNFMLRLGHRLPAGRHFLYYLSGFAFTISPAKAGEAVRSVYLRDHGVKFADSMAGFFVERLLDLSAVVMLASLILLDHPAYRALIGASAVVVVGVMICVCQASLGAWIERWGAARRRRIARVCDLIGGLLRSSERLLHARPLIEGLLLGLVAWGAEGLGFGVICQGLHIGGDVWSFFGIYAVAVLAGTAAFFLPAGIGGMEVVMTALLVERGAGLKTAIIATLLCRLATLWFAVLLGVGAASLIEVSGRKMRLTPAA